ncbi:MAG: BMP family ABC transporter substrate-binding protein [Parvibaculaceae bacterium]
MSSFLFFACLAAAGANAGLTLEGPPKVAFLYYDQRNDGGWTTAIDTARLKLEADFGISMDFVEKVRDDPAMIRPAAEKFIRRGYNIIIGTSFGHTDTLKDLAAKYPKVAFINISGVKTAANFASVYGRNYQSQYLCGMAAGAMSKSGKIGFLAADPFPRVIWAVNAFALGARKTNPKATVQVVYISAWNDPVKERAAASALISQGMDVLGQNLDTPTTQIVAEERGVWSTGAWLDRSKFAPKTTLCSQIWTWDRYFTNELKRIFAGNWQPNQDGEFPGIAEGGTDIACCNAAMPKEVVEQIEAERQAIIAGRDVFDGPLSDRDGKERVPAGQKLSDSDLRKIDWYVEGVLTSN